MSNSVYRWNRDNFMQRPLARFFTCIAFIFWGSVFGWAQDKSDVYTATVDKDGVQHVRVIGGNYYFKPNRIIVKKNIPVEITVSKEPGITPHTIVANTPEAGIVFDESLSSDPKVILFTPKETGEFAFYCKSKLLFFHSHREKGMHGIIDVVE